VNIVFRRNRKNRVRRRERNLVRSRGGPSFHDTDGCWTEGNVTKKRCDWTHKEETEGLAGSPKKGVAGILYHHCKILV